MAGDDIDTPHTLTPPTTDEDRLAWLRLIRSRRVGVATFFRLMREHGRAQAALAALPDVARNAGVARYAPCPAGVAEAEFAAGQKAGARLVCYGDAHYPAALMTIDDAPPLFWAKGRIELLDRPLIALVGARNASSLGTRMARKLATELGAAGFVTVSGLARGIDTAAHGATLQSGTIAVLAGGVDTVYPKENAELAGQIARDGLLISEAPMGLYPQARHFPARNRIISGLARGVVVVEAAARSGSLITARAALDQGRDVLAVPGHPFDARASGCNMLIRDGAALIRGADDVIEALGPAVTEPEIADPAPRPEPRSLRDTAALHAQILDRLGPSPVAEDQLIRDLALPSAQVAPALLNLELDGQIQRAAGGLLSRCT